MKNKLIIFCISSSLLMAACKKDDEPVDQPQPSDESELITTFQLSFTDTTGVNPSVTALFRDVDGPGGAAPSNFDTIKLKAGAIYHAQILLLNESANQVDTISNEVLAEAAEHLFCFTPSWGDLSIQRTDTDGTYELGLLSRWICGAAGNGTVRIQLKHQPGIKNGACDPGETDIELLFPVILQ